jgi:hypothetical protein
MFISPAFTAPVLPGREDRRKGPRFAYPAVVQIDGRSVPGRDISPEGLSVLIKAPAIGDVVQVTLASGTAESDQISAPARVVRVDRGAGGFVVGLEFLA